MNTAPKGRPLALVFNQFTLPRTEGGITRHVDLFDHVPDWQVKFIAGNRNYSSQQRFSTADERFSLVGVPEYGASLVSRAVAWSVYAAKAVVKGLTQREVDVVVGSSPQILAPVAALIVSTLRRVPFVLEIRDLWPETFVSAGLLKRGSPVYRMIRLIEILLIRSADQIVVVTGGWEEHFAEAGADLDRLTVIPNGADTAPSRAIDDIEPLVEGLSHPIAVFAGSHGPKDGLEEVLDAAGGLPEVCFLLVGDGLDKEKLMSRAVDECLDNVRFADYIPKERLQSLLGKCDIGIHCVAPLDVFRKGMSPNKLFDYMAAGIPIVSNAGEGVAELIGWTTCGVVGESGSLTESLRKMVQSDDEQRASWKAGSAQVLAERFSREDAGREMSGVMARAVSRRVVKI